MRKRVFIALNTTWNLVNFRSGLIRALNAEGYEVAGAAPEDQYVDALRSLGCHYHPLEMDRQGMNPFKDALLLARFWLLMRRVRPNIFLGFTVKPNIYGSIAATALKIPTINNVSGLGATFTKDSMITPLVRFLYRLSLSSAFRVFFQNSEDLSLFVDSGIVKREKARLLPGSGVDLDRYRRTPLPVNKKFRFLLVARLLWDKGIREYVDAVRILKGKGVNAEFCVLGLIERSSKFSVSRAQIHKWESQGIINYLGNSDDVRVELTEAGCVVLPSYYPEGTPRSLLEAAAMARPIITTRVPGCRDVVEDGVTGYLCNARDSKDLAEKMLKVLALDPEERTEMGSCGRRKMEREFDEKIVIERYSAAINEAVTSSKKR